MTVQQNRSDQLIGSTWMRKANPKRPTVGRGLPTVGCGLPTVGFPLWAVGCLPRAAHRGKVKNLAQKVQIFIAGGCPNTQEVRLSIFFESFRAY